MLSLKTCPRCTMGDVVLESDYYGQHLLCLQCGYVKDLDNGLLVDPGLPQPDRRALIEQLIRDSPESAEVG